MLDGRPELLPQGSKRLLQFGAGQFGRRKQRQCFLRLLPLRGKIEVHRDQVIGNLVRTGQQHLVFLPGRLQLLQCGTVAVLLVEFLLNQGRHPLLQSGDTCFEPEKLRQPRFALLRDGTEGLLQRGDVRKCLQVLGFRRVRPRSFTGKVFGRAFQVGQQIHNALRFQVPFTLRLHQRLLKGLNVGQIAAFPELGGRHLIDKPGRLGVGFRQQGGDPCAVLRDQPVGLPGIAQPAGQFGALGDQRLNLPDRFGKGSANVRQLALKIADFGDPPLPVRGQFVDQGKPGLQFVDRGRKIELRYLQRQLELSDPAVPLPYVLGQSENLQVEPFPLPVAFGDRQIETGNSLVKRRQFIGLSRDHSAQDEMHDRKHCENEGENQQQPGHRIDESGPDAGRNPPSGPPYQRHRSVLFGLRGQSPRMYRRRILVGIVQVADGIDQFAHL